MNNFGDYAYYGGCIWEKTFMIIQIYYQLYILYNMHNDVIKTMMERISSLESQLQLAH